MKQYEWDYSEFSGVTLKEKFESVLNILMEIRKEDPIRFIVASHEISNLFEASRSHGYVSDYIHLANFTYVGKFMGIILFKSADVARDELIVCGPTENSVIKFVNYVELFDVEEE